jgi:hypothetical protein
MNNLPPEVQEVADKVVKIVGASQDAVLSGWQKMAKLTNKTDFLAVLEPSEKDTSILILTRESGLMLLGEKGFDVGVEHLQMLQEPATGLTPESKAIWVVVLFDQRTHVTKLIHQPMANAGSA